MNNDIRDVKGPETYLRMSDITIAYGEKIAVDDVSLTVDRGELVSIIGPSGCGKSTLLHVLAGLKTPRSGTINLDSLDITGDPGSHLRAGYVFQDHRLLPWRTVRANLEIAMGAADIARDEWHERITRNLKLLEVEDYRDAWPMKLSGGQRQRVSIARALSVSPDIILMDEPFSGLDEVTGRSIRIELDRMRTIDDTPILFVTHSIKEALYLSDRILVMSRGPARVLRELEVTVPRPRSYEDGDLRQMEKELVDSVLSYWENTGGPEGAPERMTAGVTEHV